VAVSVLLWQRTSIVPWSRPRSELHKKRVAVRIHDAYLASKG
jgi:hypothetical protein